MWYGSEAKDQRHKPRPLDGLQKAVAGGNVETGSDVVAGIDVEERRFSAA
jgi:hypothetical protein